MMSPERNLRRAGKQTTAESAMVQYHCISSIMRARCLGFFLSSPLPKHAITTAGKIVATEGLLWVSN